jgi:tetratricopeptide (TPR) repeat protein
MSETRKNIAIIAGRVSNLHRFDCFGHLGGEYRVNLLTLDYEKVLNGYTGSLRQIIFDEKEDMAGYMPGLENHLQGQDLIICYESFQLSSFQASRIAQRQGIPVWIIADDPKPFRYVEYKNIRSIQSDIANHAARFLVGTEASRNALISEGINPQLMDVVQLGVDCPPQSEISRLRQKFRSYVGISASKVVITFEGSLDENSYAFELIKGFRLACELQPAIRENFVMLLAGEGPKSHDLKCLAFDAGLKHNVMFMHQDMAKLSNDIFSSSDFYFINPKQDESQPYFAPARALAAAAWGAIPVGAPDAVLNELFAGNQSCLADPSFQSVAMKFIEFSNQRSRITQMASRLIEHVCLQHNASSIASNIVRPILDKVFHTAAEELKKSSVLKTQKAESDLDHDARLELYSEQLAAVPDQDFVLRSQIESNKAHIFCERRLFDQALESYTAAISLDSRNVGALTGLGSLSYQTQSYEEAMKFFKRALAIQSEDTAASAGLGMVYAKLGLHNDAIYWFEKSITHGNHRPGILTLMVQSCLESKAPNDALVVLERVEELVGPLETTQMAIARLHVKIGNGEQGREIMRKVLSGG